MWFSAVRLRLDRMCVMRGRLMEGLMGWLGGRCADVCVVCVIVWMVGGLVGGKGLAAFRLSGGMKGSLVRLFRLGYECVVVGR
jgi:hypothetical protein